MPVSRVVYTLGLFVDAAGGLRRPTHVPYLSFCEFRGPSDEMDGGRCTAEKRWPHATFYARVSASNKGLFNSIAPLLLADADYEKTVR